MCLSHGLKMWVSRLDIILRFFCHFSQVELSHAQSKVNRCVRNSYSFMPILLKFYRCFGDGLKMITLIPFEILCSPTGEHIAAALSVCPSIKPNCKSNQLETSFLDRY